MEKNLGTRSKTKFAKSAKACVCKKHESLFSPCTVNRSACDYESPPIKIVYVFSSRRVFYVLSDSRNACPIIFFFFSDLVFSHGLLL